MAWSHRPHRGLHCLQCKQCTVGGKAPHPQPPPRWPGVANEPLQRFAERARRFAESLRRSVGRVGHELPSQVYQARPFKLL